MDKNYRFQYDYLNSTSDLIKDYINQADNLKSFVNHFPTIENFGKQIDLKSKHKINRNILFNVIKSQNKNLVLSEESNKNINLIKCDNTFTITTGHQLCLCTGPVFFIYKIFSVINLVKKIKVNYPDYNFIPIFWMASEDHDFEEINHFNFFGKKIVWDNGSQSGAVGRMSLYNINNVLEEIKDDLLANKNGLYIFNLLKKTYQNHQNLADATRYLINELFGKYGLVIVDGDDKRLKKCLINVIKKDIIRKGFYEALKKSSDKISKVYKLQALVKENNFFELTENNRIKINNNSFKKIDSNPEIFSPNVLLRPLYQEMILPNICYVGGPSEVSYWLQLKEMFDQEKVPFPILILRDTVFIAKEKNLKRFKDLGFNIMDIFKHEHLLQKEYVTSKSSLSDLLHTEKEEIRLIYKKILDKNIDKSLIPNINALLKKQLNALENIESKIMRSLKQKNVDAVNFISKIKNDLFPKNTIQERYENFITFYLRYGDGFMNIIEQNIDALDSNFVILKK